MKKKLTFFDKLMLLVAISLVICLWCGVYAGTSDPRENIIIAFFGLAYPFILFANILMLAYWSLRKKWIFSAVTLVAICIGWHTLISTFGLIGTEGKSEKSEEGLIRLMTYNVHNFKPYGEDNTIEAKEKMFAVVKAQNPDVVCFQEFFTKPRGPYDTIDSLKKMLDAKYYYFVPTQKTESEAIGYAIFSKYPIKNKGEIMFENSFGNGSIYVDLTVNNQDIRVYNVHLQSISFVKEDYNYLEKVTKEMSVEKSSSKRILKMLKS
ncbi:MAG: endonuclease, partial [Pedobacter sp.]